MVGVGVVITDGVGVGRDVGVGVGVPPPGLMLMPLIFGFSVPEVNWITIWPFELAVAVNDRAMALFWPPADA